MKHREPVLDFSQMSNEEVAETLRNHKIGLKVEEARKIAEILGRDPTLTEATIWGIQGSEHSSYKSSWIHLKKLPTEAPPVILGPKEDSGILELCTIRGTKYGIVISHESHNAPSQIVPYEGAATGVGGICRDVACMGARVIGCLDMLRFGPIENPANKVIANGVIAGIAGYGNPLGVPNYGGDIFFNETFQGFTLVNVVALGILKEKNVIHSYCPKEAGMAGYDLIVVGKPSDRSGFGGASFASLVVDESKKDENKGAVQEPNPFLERHLFASFYDLFDILERENLIEKVALKDMGAGGIMCATVELVDAAGFGADIAVEKIHAGEEGLPPHIIFCSETQERFCFAVHPDLTEMFLEHFNVKWDLPSVAVNARASVIGKVNESGIFHVTYQGETICNAKASDITRGIRYHRPMEDPKRTFPKLKFDFPKDLTEPILSLLGSENIADTTPVSENYDQTVQGYTVRMRTEAEAGIGAPLRDEPDLSEEEKQHGFAISVAGHPRLGRISPYWQGAHAVLTSIQKVAATGAHPSGLTDCLNYGNPEKPGEMWEFAEGVRGIAECAGNIHLVDHPRDPTPFVSGNVSLYKTCSPSAVLACLGTLSNVENAIGNAATKKGNTLFLVGERPAELGGSEMAAILGKWLGEAPKFDFQQAEKELRFVIGSAEKRLTKSCSVIAEGGLIATLSKMCFQGDLGFSGDLSSLSPEQLFSEGNGYLIEVDDPSAFENLAKKHGVKVMQLGKFGLPKKIAGKVFSLDYKKSKKVWEEGLRKKLG